ncbi:MAG: redoxin domain-containing protein [Cyanobacteria bacterium J06642_3]
MNTTGKYAPDFEIPGIDQEVYHLGSYLQKFKAIAVVFMGNVLEVNQYLERLKKIQADFEEQKFTLIGIDSNYYPGSIAESMEQMRQFAAQKELNFPYLRDSTQDVAKSFKAEILPTVYLLDSNGVIRYQGRIDDCAEPKEQVDHRYLLDGIVAVLSEQNIAKNYIAPVGSAIEWRP